VEGSGQGPFHAGRGRYVCPMPDTEVPAVPDERLAEIHRLLIDMHMWVQWIYWVVMAVVGLVVVGGVALIVWLTT
jgi:hypothetical protein